MSSPPVSRLIAFAASVLPTPGLALQQQRPLQAQGEEQRRGQPLVGQVLLVGERG